MRHTTNVVSKPDRPLCFLSSARHKEGAKPKEESEGKALEKLKRPFGYREQSCESLPGYLAKYAPTVMEKLGTHDPNDITCIEMGDGNLNLVFIVSNTKLHEKQVIVKQALPYVRCVGESWPLTLDRAFFEYTALTAEKEACPDFVPAIYFFSKSDGLMVMEYIAPPAIILRKGLILGIKYPTVAADLGVFCAKTLFKTSGFSLPPLALRRNVSTFLPLTLLYITSLDGELLFASCTRQPSQHSSSRSYTGRILDQELGNVCLDRTGRLYRTLHYFTQQPMDNSPIG